MKETEQTKKINKILKSLLHEKKTKKKLKIE